MRLFTYVLAVQLLMVPAAAVAGFPSGVQSLAEQRQDRIVLQHYDLSCGAAALATLLRYQHGLNTDERAVALGLISRAAYLSNPEIVRIRQGFSLLDMKRHVEWLALSGQALGGLEMRDLQQLAPAIVPVRLRGYNHFVVYRGAWGDSVLIADPAYGNRSLSTAQFEKAWVNYAEFGRVAFTVQRRDGLIPPNRLGVSERDFPVLAPRPSR